MPKTQQSSDNSRRPSRGGRPRGERHLSVRSELRREPDVKKLARAVVALALAQAEADAQAEKERTPRRETNEDAG